MVQTLSRRNLLSLAAAAGMAPVLTGEARAATALKFGPARAFSYESLKAMARERAGKPYVAPPRPNPEITT